MIEATIELLRTTPIEEITLRDIAERSGHHHRFVGEWFGGKAALFMAAMTEVIESIPPFAIVEPGHDPDSIHPDTELSIVVMAWLMANDPDVLLRSRPNRFPDDVFAMYRAAGAEPEVARLLTQRLLATVMSMVLFGDILELQPGDLIKHRELERRITALLLESEGGADPTG